MIYQMLAWQTSWRSRTTSFIALYAVIGVLTGISMITSDQVQAQTARALVGTLIVKVPTGLLPSVRDHWLYVNGQIVNAPPNVKNPVQESEFMHHGPSQEGVAKHEYWDPDGLAARSKNGRFTYLRSGLRERIFESHPIELAPGLYVVELLTRRSQSDTYPLAVTFPFAVARIEAQVVAGKTEEIEFGIPTGTNGGFNTPRASFSHGTLNLKDLEQTQSKFAEVVKGYEADPIVPVLNQVLLNLSITPPSRPSAFANLPDSIGGGRELDAQQVSLIIRQLEYEYNLSSISSTQSRSSANPPLAAHFALLIKEHNKRIDNFRQIVKALEQAKRQ